MTYEIIHGDCLDVLRGMEDESVQCCVTSPPYYGLRDYGVDGQIGLEPTPEEYIEKMVSVFREVRRVLKSDGTLWVNIGDSYVGSANNGGTATKTMRGPQAATGKNLPTKRGDGLKSKDLIGIPWMLAFALRADGWYLRQDIIWHKPNPMPESVQDRCTKAHEYVFLLTNQCQYYFDADSIKERSVYPNDNRKARQDQSVYMHASGKSGRLRAAVNPKGARSYESRNRRSVWTISPEPCGEPHFAAMPKKLARLCILAGSKPGDVILDPFTGAGTTGLVALCEGRSFIGSELNHDYCDIARKRIAAAAAQGDLFHEVAR